MARSSNSRKKAALVTGASSGIGKATTLKLIDAGYAVYAAARRVEQMQDLARAGATVVALDLTKDEDMVTAVDRIVSEHGAVDILINNAGYGSYGAIEDVPVDEGRRQFEVNLFGLARLTQLVLPKMRANRFGKIVNITSIGGKVYTPFGGWYHATKHALEGWSDSLRLEAKPFGIDVVIVEPGGIKTEWGHIAADNLKKTSGTGAYAAAANKAADGMLATYSNSRLSDPSVVATTILKAIAAPRPRTRYHTGYMAGTVLRLRRLLSDRMFDRIITTMV
ncbi:MULTISPECIES: oxidoreductase [unclassified Mesorhizobium]|uniref:oxidoreductase n=1 Tax=unclassified Mesorhizobium TaxID=325217 RepID=UPI002415D95D|nr:MULTISPECIES: oxidoreductase [unclassified Mesorhizobium]WFP61046.1 oxidoreductase [Mesorhizobium sp. WSM4904]WFP74275.1 oxidoreductase [Mesorhizobium sp. WSM4906]